MGDDGALGEAGGARRVHDGPGVIERRRHSLRQRTSGRHHVVVVVAQRERVLGGEGPHLEPILMQQDQGSAVAGDELQLGGGQPPVERDQDRPQAGAGEEGLEDVCCVLREECHPFSGSDAAAGQPCRQPPYSLVQVAVRQGQLAVVIDEGSLVGPDVGVVGDPVVGGRRHHCTTVAAHV